MPALRTGFDEFGASKWYEPGMWNSPANAMLGRWGLEQQR